MRTCVNDEMEQATMDTLGGNLTVAEQTAVQLSDKAALALPSCEVKSKIIGRNERKAVDV